MARMPFQEFLLLASMLATSMGADSEREGLGRDGALLMPEITSPSATILHPLDWDESDDLVQVRWRVTEYERGSGETRDAQILIHINGNLIGSSPHLNGSWEFLLSDFAASGAIGHEGRRAINVMIMLCLFDVDGSILKFASSDQVDIFTRPMSTSRGTRQQEAPAEEKCAGAENWGAWTHDVKSESPEPAIGQESEAGAGGGDENRGRVVILSFHSNRPDFLLLQARALRQFMLDDYLLVVIDDAKVPSVQNQFREAAANFGAEYRQTPDWGRVRGRISALSPSVIHGMTLTWAMQEIVLEEFQSSLVFFIEGDIFPVAPFSATSFMRGFDIAGPPQTRRDENICFALRYIWVGLAFFDLPKLPNKHLLQFHVDEIHGVHGDTGSALHRFLDASPEVRVRAVRHTCHIRRDRNLDSIPAVARAHYRDWFKLEIHEGAFVHYGSASNWKLGHMKLNSPIDFLPEKTRYVEWLVRKSMEGAITFGNDTQAISS